MRFICHLFVVGYFFLGLLSDIILYANEVIIIPSSHSECMLSNWLEETEFAFEHNFAAQNKDKIISDTS